MIISKQKLFQNKINHILYGSKTSDHKWVLQKNNYKNIWKQIKELIKLVLKEGEESLYKKNKAKEVFIKSYRYEESIIRVTYIKILPNEIRIGTAWRGLS